MSIRLASVLSITLFASVCFGTDSTTWARFRGPNGDGKLPKVTLNTNWSTKPPKVLWQTSLTDEGYAGMISAKGLVYIVDHQGTDDIVRCLNLKDGSEAWRYTYPDAPQSSYGFARATPCLEGDRLYVVSRLGKVVCLNAKTHDLVWQIDMVKDLGGVMPMHGYACSPVIEGSNLIVSPGAADGALALLDKETGKLVRKCSSGAVGYATPVVATLQGKKQVVAFLANRVTGIDLTTGKELWSQPWETTYGMNCSQPIVLGNDVFISATVGMGCEMVSVGGAGTTVRWKNRAMQQHFTSGLEIGGKIYGTSDPGILACLDATTGDLLWKQPGFEKGATIAVGDLIIAQNGANGDVVMIKADPTAYQEIARMSPLKGQAWTSPILVGKTLLIRNPTAIAAVDLS